MTPLQVPQEDAELIRNLVGEALAFIRSISGDFPVDTYVERSCRTLMPRLEAALSALARAQPAQGEAEAPEIDMEAEEGRLQVLATVAIERAMRARGMSRDQLAAKAHYAVEVVDGLLDGDRGYELYDLACIGLACGVRFDFCALDAQTGMPASPPAQAAALEDAVRQLDANRQTWICPKHEHHTDFEVCPYCYESVLAALQAQGQGETP